MGENPDFVFTVGAPGLDLANTTTAIGRTGLLAQLGLTGPERFLLVTLHPTTARPDADAANVAALLGALAEINDRSFVFTGVNADPGHRTIDDAIGDFVAARPKQARLFASLGSERYWAALRLADAVIGNSSSGIVEAPAAGVPSINIGDRQLGRLRAASIIDCPAEPAAIGAALGSILEGQFRVDPEQQLPYGRGGASEKIAGTLRKVDLRAAFPKYFHDLAP
jgi:UDP-hydrolysing UDP-N-acetyl-D-glucosamine 2-epimerase